MKKALLLVCLLVLSACTGHGGNEFTVSDVVGKWQLATLDGQPAPRIMRDGGITLEILADGKFAGQAPVNRYFGQITHDNKGLRVAPVGTTMMAGPAELMQAEQAFLKTLNAIESVDLKKGQLTVHGPEGGYLVFDKIE